MLAVVIPCILYIAVRTFHQAGIATYCVGRFIGEFGGNTTAVMNYFSAGCQRQALIPNFCVAMAFFIYAWRRPSAEVYLSPGR